jgi:hypothetical protein
MITYIYKLKQGDKFKENNVIYIACETAKQSEVYKNEYTILSCACETKNGFKKDNYYTLRMNIKFGTLGRVKLIKD